MAKLKELTATLKIDSVKALKSLEKFNKFLGTIAKSVDTLQTKLTAMRTNLEVSIGGKGASAAGGGAKKAAKGFDDLDKSTKKTTKSTEELGEETKKTAKETAKGEARVRKLQARLEAMKLSLIGSTRETNTFRQSVEKLFKALKKSKRLKALKALGVRAKEASGSVKESFGTIQSASIKATAAIAVIGAASFAFVKKWAAATDSMAKSGQKFNVPFQELQGLVFAAKSAGASATDVQDAIKDMSILISEATRDSMHPFNTTLAQMGLSIESLGDKTVTEKFGIISDGLNRISDSSLRTELGIKSIGPAAVQLGVLMRKGSKGIEAAAKELENLGLVLTEEEAAEAAAFNDELLRTDAFLQAIGKTIASKMSPQIRKMLKSFKIWLAVNKDIIATRVLEWFEKFVQLVTKAAPKVLELVETLGKVVAVANDIVGAVGGIEPALLVAGTAFVTFKLIALASIAPVALAITAMTAGLAFFIAKSAQERRRQQAAAAGARDELSSRRGIVLRKTNEEGKSEVTALGKTKEGTLIRTDEMLIATLQAELNAEGKKSSTQVRKETISKRGFVGNLFLGITPQALNEKEQRLQILEQGISEARQRREKNIGRLQIKSAELQLKNAQGEGTAGDPNRKRFGDLQVQLLKEGTKFSKKNLAELKNLAKLLKLNIAGLPGKPSGRSASAGAETRDVPLTLQQKLAKILGTGIGLNVSSFRPSGVGALIQHINASITLQSPNISVKVESSAQGKALGREIGKGIFEKLGDDIARTYAAQKGVIIG